jgi:hypothetical protein
VTAIIDPQRSAPGINGLPLAQAGQRYLLLNPINKVDAWNNNGVDFTANTYDIIEYTGSNWMVSWQSDTEILQYVTNLTTGIQYKWNGENWVKSWEGEYPSGQWSLVF